MSPLPLAVVIPTYMRCDLLDRTLASLCACVLPPTLDRVVVVENGKRSGADAVTEKYAKKLPLRYRFSEPPNKSEALNSVLRELQRAFIIFLDDDVRLDPNILVAYVGAAGESRSGKFFGGRCLVDYEKKPPAWLVPYLPPSAKGWDLGPTRQPLDVPDALGFNWAAFAPDLIAAGGFDQQRGPGTAARGQESEMQEKLLARRVNGFYLPDAVVWHFVPEDRCSPDWMVNRIRQMGVTSGIKAARSSFRERAVKAVTSELKLAVFKTLLALSGDSLKGARRFHYRYRASWYAGILTGLRQKEEKKRTGQGSAPPPAR